MSPDPILLELMRQSYGSNRYGPQLDKKLELNEDHLLSQDLSFVCIAY